MAEKVENAKKPEKSKFSLAEIIKVHTAEFKRIVWPSRNDVIKQTITVIFVSIVIGLIIWGLDVCFEQAFKAVLTALGKI